jgi:hypothetical protein
MRAYGIPVDACDEYCRLGEFIALEAMKHWVVAIQGCFKAHYLRQRTRADLEQQVQINTNCKLPGIFASLDLEELPPNLARAISRQGEESERYP